MSCGISDAAILFRAASFRSGVVICVFERSGCHFHDGHECRLNPADVVPLTSIRAVELRKIPKSKHKSALEAN